MKKLRHREVTCLGVPSDTAELAALQGQRKELRELCSVGAVLWLSKVEIRLGTGMGTDVHPCATGTQTCCLDFLQPHPPHAWYHPGGQSPEASQDARETLQLLSSKTGRHSSEMSSRSRVTKLSSKLTGAVLF